MGGSVATSPSALHGCAYPRMSLAGATWHVMVGTKASLGYKCKVRNITVRVTDSVVAD